MREVATAASEGLINVPKCLASGPNARPPMPPTPPPAVNDSLPLQVFAGKLAGNKVAVAMMNTEDPSVSPAVATIRAQWSDVGLAPGTEVSVLDAMSGEEKGTSTGPLVAQVPGHDIAVFVLTPTGRERH